MLVAAVWPGTTFDWVAPSTFRRELLAGGGAGSANYDVSSDGKRFLMVHEPELVAPRLNGIQGWQRLANANAAPNH